VLSIRSEDGSGTGLVATTPPPLNLPKYSPFESEKMPSFIGNVPVSRVNGAVVPETTCGPKNCQVNVSPPTVVARSKSPNVAEEKKYTSAIPENVQHGPEPRVKVTGTNVSSEVKVLGSLNVKVKEVPGLLNVLFEVVDV
jgi:hypothetical protein